MAEGAGSETSRPAGEPGPPREPGLVRTRLLNRLSDPSSYSVGLVVAPAGSGKSRLLSHLAGAYTGPVAWCGTPDPIPRTEASLVQWVSKAACGRQLPDLGSLVDAMTGPDVPVLVILDDVHLLEGTPAEAALGDLIVRMPQGMRLVAASRVNLDLDLSRLRVSGRLVEIGPDDLRFRTWEVEELFRDVYHEPLLPEDVAALAWRTAGWAAYLQLFFLATARKPQVERRRMLASLANRTRLVSDYLGRHALSGLSDDLQEFLIRTSPLRRPTAELCDEILGRADGAEMLAELERRQIFTERIDDHSFRYHSVLLSYLDAKLVETLGRAKAREQHRRAGALLEREGYAEDAVAAYAKGEDWEGVARVLGHVSSPPSRLGEAWIEALPPTVVDTDSQLLMVKARLALTRGALADAANILRHAERVAASEQVAISCRTERDQILMWADPDRPAGTDWVGVLRQATRRQPDEAYRVAAALPGPTGRFAEGTAALIAGNLNVAGRVMRTLANHPDAGPVLVAAARLMGTMASVGVGQVPSRSDTDLLREEIEAAGVPWLERVARAVVLAAELSDERLLLDFLDACEREGDRWGQATIGLVAGIAMLTRGGPAEGILEHAASTFNRLGAPVLEATALACAALAAATGGNRDRALPAAERARSQAAALDVPGAAGVAALALGLLKDKRQDLARARQLLEPLGVWPWFAPMVEQPGAEPAVIHPLDPPLSASGPPVREGERVAPVSVRCLGGFSLAVEGAAIDESVAKPMERSLLHLLCMRPGEGVHRDLLVESLWPEADPEAGRHRLQVAVSSLRRLLAGAGAKESQLLSRSGEAYRLELPEGSYVDVLAFEAAVRNSNSARSQGDTAEEERALKEALDTYGGPLLPGDGPAEWVVTRRDQLQSGAADVASRLASLRLQNDNPAGALEAARTGVTIDRYRDDIWKLLIDAAERAGNVAEAGQARRAYETVLDELT